MRIHVSGSPRPLFLFDVLESRQLLATYAVTTTADSGGGSLRQAILNANANVGADTIIFSIGAGVRTITPATPLPAITDSVTVDATTQPGYGGVNPFIQLRGTSLVGTTAIGLDVPANGVLIKGLNICSFAYAGIRIDGSFNAVEACYIGTDILGFGPLPNAYGVQITGNNNRVGVDVGQSFSSHNLISGNQTAIDIAGGDFNVVTGNYVGINFDGTALMPNVYGILVTMGAVGTIVGAPFTARRNVVAGNDLNISVGNATDTVVQGNLIGVSPLGTAYESINTGYGIAVFTTAPNTLIGGPGAGNLISGNGGAGIFIQPNTMPNSVIEGNFIGTDLSGIFAIPNYPRADPAYGGDGSGIIGGSTGLTIRNNLISGNAGWGLKNVTGATLVGNKIGTDFGGGYAIANQLGGLSRETAGSDPTFRVGGTLAGEGNLISGNNGPGIQLAGGGSGGSIVGNKIGTAADGNSTIGNSGPGIDSNNAALIIGGTTAAERNLISGNTIGIQFSDATANNNSIRGNWIGLRGDGIAALPNNLGIALSNGAHDNEIGGTVVNAGNVISGNSVDGVNIKPNSHNNRLLNNRIGTNAAGTGAVPNGGAGVGVQISTVEIGRVGTLGESIGNTISGNLGDGIEFYGGMPLDTSFVRSNRIGVGVDGVTPIPNGGAGIQFNTGGGRATVNSNNVIHRNTGPGIGIANSAGTNIEIYGNSINRNGGLGIDLNEDGVTANGPSPRPGPNGMTNYPDLAMVATSGGRSLISGSYAGLPNTLYTLDLYASPTADPSLYGEGATALAALPVLTDAIGAATFNLHLDTPVPLGTVVSATASRGANTSEFSKSVSVVDALGPRATGIGLLYEVAPLKLVVKFDEDVSASLSTAAFSVTRIGGGSVPVTGITWDSSTFSATLTLGTLPPDGNYRLTALASVVHDVYGNALDGNGDNINGDDYTGNFFVLAGDADRNRTVNFNDLLTLARNYNQTGRTFSQGNFNYSPDGLVNFNDLLVLAQRYGSSVLTLENSITTTTHVDAVRRKSERLELLA